MSSRVRVLVVLISLAAVLPCCGDAPPGDADAEWTRPFDGHLLELAPERVSVLQVVDERSGAPIAGAVVRQHYEIDVGPDGWAPVVREARTDAHGLVSFRIPEDELVQEGVREGHWTVHAEGYAATEEYGGELEEVVELGPAVSRHGRIVDALGRPLAGLRVGYKEGCGHAPFLEEAATDEDGRFVISGVNASGTIFYAARGVLGDYFDGPLRRIEETPWTHVAEPCARVQGRIVGADLDALEPRMVHGPSESRGVFARLDEKGAFTLDGVDLRGMLTLYWGPDGLSRELDLGTVRPHVPFVWDLGAGVDMPLPDGAPEHELRVEFVSSHPPADLSVTAYRAQDGREVDGFHLEGSEPAAPEDRVLILAPGRYDIVAGGDGEEWFAPPLAVEIGWDAPPPVSLELRRRPALVVEGRVEGDVRMQVAWTDAQGAIDHEGQLVDDVFLPPGAPARVAVHDDMTARFFDVGPVEETPSGPVRRVTIDWPAPRILRFRSDVTPASVRLGGVEHEVRRHEGGYEIHTSGDGTLELVVRREDGPGGHPLQGEPLPPVRRMLTLDGPRGTPRDLGALDWPALERGVLTVLRADGTPVVDEQVEIAAFDPYGTGERVLWHQPFTDAEGRVSSCLLRPGAWVLCEAGRLALRRVIQGPGPWTLREGPCSLEVEVHGPGGPLLGTSLMLDACTQSEEQAGGPYEIRGLQPGPHTLLVTAPGHRGQERRVLLSDGESRRLRIQLDALD